MSRTRPKLVVLKGRGSGRGLGAPFLSYRRILASMLDGVVVVNHDGCVIIANDEAARIYGVPLKELLIPLTEYAERFQVRTLEGERTAPVGVRALSGEFVEPAERLIRTPDGKDKAIRASAAPLRDHRGDIVAAVVVVGDITERKRAEEALQKQLAAEDRFTRIAASVPGLICSYQLRPDGSASFPFATAASEDLLGLSPESLSNDASPLFSRMHPDDVERVKASVAESARSASRWHAEYRYLHPTKGLRWIEGWSEPKRDPDGSILWHGFAMDVTDRKRAEEALRDAARRKNNFLAMLSHELRNPLAPIRNSMYLLERLPADSPQAARAKEVVNRQTEHLARLVDDLLDVTRIGRGKIRLERTVIDLRDVVRRTCEDHRSLFDESEVELHIDLPPGPVRVDADAQRLAQVLGNLLQNAAKFTPAGGAVTVAVREREGRARVSVRDTGIGIEPGQIAHIFEPFAQEDRGLARTRGGLGLGLALAKGVVELHGGTITAHSEGAGRGSEFVFMLPATAPAVAMPPTGSTTPESSLEILVIEDNVDAAHTLADVLALNGHRVHLARDGLTGIRMARELKPDVVLCDIGLPDVDGYEVARILRQDASLRSTRLIALSGYAQPEDRARSRAAGFSAHLAKPTPLEELSAVLRESEP